MLRVSFDAWPLLVTDVWDVVTDADVAQLERANEEALRRRSAFASLVDVTRLTEVPSARLRQKYGQWRKAHEAELAQRVRGVAFVLGHRPLLRGALVALSWTAKHPAPESYFETRDEALGWLRAVGAVASM